MRFRILNTGVLLALGIAGGVALLPAPTRADNNITYNFNEPNGRELGWVGVPDASGTVTPFWDWNLEQSSVGGGWQAFSGTNSANSAAYFLSPCFVIDNVQDWVNFKVDHRFKFPLSGTTANQLGQIQYRVDSGSGWGAWSGIPTEYFVKFNGGSTDNKPNYGPPLFAPLVETSGTLPVQAWSGTTTSFDTGFHVQSEFTLFYDDFNLQDGYDIQFRFALANDTAVSGTNTLVWEVNKVQIEGVVPCLIPEPGTLALAGMGGLGCLFIVARRRRSRAASTARAVGGSTAVTIVLAAAAVGLLAATPARAQTSWNFELSNGGWMRSGSTAPVNQTIASANRWMWTGTTGALPVTGGTSPHWHVRAIPVQSSAASAAVFLTSTTFSGLVATNTGFLPAQNARISIAHGFFFNGSGTNGRPITTGQLQYQLNGSGTWIGLPLDAFTDGGSVTGTNLIFGPSPFKSGSSFQIVDQADFIAPTYLTPSGPAALPFVSGSAAAFLGSTPAWPGDYYVPSEAYLNADTGLPSTGITSLQLRFTNLSLAGTCDNEDGWNIRFVQVDFSEVTSGVPEPGTLALGGSGLVAVAVTAAIRRRRRHQRPSRPSERP